MRYGFHTYINMCIRYVYFYIYLIYVFLPTKSSVSLVLNAMSNIPPVVSMFYLSEQLNYSNYYRL